MAELDLGKVVGPQGIPGAKGDPGTSFWIFTTNYSAGQEAWNTWSEPGHRTSWTVNESTANVGAGDSVMYQGANSSKNGHVFVLATVVSVAGQEITSISKGMVEKGEQGDLVAGVASFNGRGGAVTPASGDYTAEMVGAATMEQVNSAIGAAVQSAVLDSWGASY